MPVKWDNIRGQAHAQGQMRVRCPRPKWGGKAPADVGRGGVTERWGGDEHKSSHSHVMWKENSEWWEAPLGGKNRHGSGPEAVGDPSLHLPPMDFHLVEMSFGECEQVSPI